jgi:ParB family transcriptional regulator, chromosome partitioning protein
MLNPNADVSTEIQEEARLAPTGQLASVFIPFNKLRMNPDNRLKRHSKESVVRRAAEILDVGVLQNMVVEPADGAGLYMIQAGNGRYLSIEHNIKKGLLPKTFGVECKVNSEGFSSDAIKIAENSNRTNLHPVEEFQAFSRMIELEGRDLKAVANAYGRTQKFVTQRLKLSKLSPILISALLEDEITLEVAEAFTLTDDQAKQDSVWKSLRSAWSISPHLVKRQLLEDIVTTEDARFKFVGSKEYKKAGGAIAADLFGDDHAVCDVDVLDALVSKKLQKAVKSVSDEGFRFVDAGFRRDFDSYPHFIHPTLETKKSKKLAKDIVTLKASLEKLEAVDHETLNDAETDLNYTQVSDHESALYELEEKYTDSLAYTPEEKLRSGIQIYVQDGQIQINRGVVSLEQWEAERDAENAENAEGDAERDTSTCPKQLSKVLTADLDAYKALALKIKLLENPSVAKDLLLFNLLSGAMSQYSSTGTELCVSAQNVTPSSSRDDLADFAGLDILSKLKDALPVVQNPQGREARFKALCNLSDAEKDKLFAYVASNALTSSNTTSLPVLSDVAERVSLDCRESWHPTKENYFGRISFDLLIEHAVDLCGEAWMESRDSLKKAKLAEELATLFVNPKLRPDGADQRFASFVPKIME